MVNTETDRLNMVRVETQHNTFPLFKRKRAESYGFALVVLRKGVLLGSILSSDIAVESDITRIYERLGVKDGDEIFSVNLGPQPLKIQDTLPTNDWGPRPYTMELTIQVSDPLKFTLMYIQQADPIARTRSAIEGYIQLMSGPRNHDDITDDTVRQWAIQALTLEAYKSYGLRVQMVQKVSVAENPGRAQESELERRKRFEIKRLETEGLLERTKEQQNINLEQLKQQGKIDSDSMQTEANRREEEKQENFHQEQEKKRREYENQKILEDLAEQQKRQQQIHALDMLKLKQQMTTNETTEQYRQEMKIRTLTGEYRIKEHEQALEMIDTKHARELELGNVDQQLLIEGKRARHAGDLEIEAVNRQHQIEEITTKRSQEVEAIKLLQEYTLQVRRHQLEIEQAKHEQEQQKIEWENKLQRELLTRLGSDISPALATRIREQIMDEKSSLGGAVNDPELRYLLDIISGNSGTTPPLLNMAKASSAVSEAPASPESQEPEATTKPQALPGVVLQKEETVEIPDFGLKLITATLSEEICLQAALENNKGFIIYMINEQGPARGTPLKVADIVLEINGITIQTAQDISQAVGSRQTGEAVSVCILRGEDQLYEYKINNPA
jgi:hypothetical protein